MIWGSGGSKSRLAKATGAEPAGQMRDEQLHAVVARSTFRSQNVQSTPFSDHFWKLRCWKSTLRCRTKQISKSKCAKHLSLGALLEAQMFKRVVARSTFRSQNVQSTPFSDHFWKLRCWKSTLRCRTKQISKSKCAKHLSLGALLEAQMFKRVVARSTFRSQNAQSTPFSGHFWKLRCWKSTLRCRTKQISKSKCAKHLSLGALLEAQMFKRVVARSTCPSQNVQDTPGSEHFWKLRCWKSARRCGGNKFRNLTWCKTHQVRSTFGSWVSKSARRCGAKHISNLKALTADSLGALLEVRMAQWIRHLATSEKNVQVS